VADTKRKASLSIAKDGSERVKVKLGKIPVAMPSRAGNWRGSRAMICGGGGAVRAARS